MKPLSVSSVLSILAVVTSMTVIAQAAIIPRSSSVSDVHKNLIAVGSLEQSVHNQVNQYRQGQKLPPLAYDQAIAEQARVHSLSMANSKRISHNGFDNRIEVIGKTIDYSSVAENVASNQGYENPDNTAVKGWIKSPGHRQNMVGNFNLTGIGIVERGGSYYFTQIFVQKR